MHQDMLYVYLETYVRPICRTADARGRSWAIVFWAVRKASLQKCAHILFVGCSLDPFWLHAELRYSTAQSHLKS